MQLAKRVIPILTGVATLALMLLITGVVWAQDAGPVSAPVPDPSGDEDMSALTELSKLAFQVLTPIVTIFATWLAHRIVGVFEKKSKIDVPDSIENKIDAWIEQGIFFAAEKSYNKVKAKTEKLKGPEKLEAAADFVFAMAAQRGWADWTKDKIKAKVEAKLGTKRANGGVPKLEATAEAEG